MQLKKYTFSKKKTTYYFDAEFELLEQLTDRSSTILITDENIFHANHQRFSDWKVILLKPGEAFKTQAAVDEVIRQLIAYEADRKFTIVGVGGGVVTDVTGYVASVYMRGLRFGYVPVSILGMVDAAIGGKNGVDVGPYKNLVGTITQPEFLLYDISMLKTLPQTEWINGFAEIIKHACIRDAAMFKDLQKNDISIYMNDKSLLNKLVRKNAAIKSDIVVEDEFEKGERRLLNFGHTWGHAIETTLQIPHGHAVSIGMVMACKLSENITGFKKTNRVIELLQQYGLPVSAEGNKKEMFQVLKMDKKKDSSFINYVLLKDIGDAVVKKIAITELEKLIIQ
jgi:3-dehydroquinate synthase